MKDENFRNLPSKLYLAVGAKVMVTQNILQQAGICNGTTGIVKDIVYNEGESAPSLPKFVWVDFGNEFQCDQTFFPNCPERSGWVPIPPMSASFATPSSRTQSGYEEHTKKMLPLCLAWAWTIWKAQGQTIKGKMVVYLSNSEGELGITYVALSRATRLEDIGIGGGFTEERLLSKIKNHSKMAIREREAKGLSKLAAETEARLRAED